MNQFSFGVKLAATALRRSIHFYLKHPWLILLLSTVPTIQRFWLILQDIDPASPAAIGSEILAQASRAILLWLILRLTFGEDPILAPLSIRQRWQRFTAFIDRYPWSFATQFLVLAAAFGLLDALPNLMIMSLVAEQDQPLVTAIVVALKNPTVIAVTFIWLTSVAHLAARAADADNEPSQPTPFMY